MAVNIQDEGGTVLFSREKILQVFETADDLATLPQTNCPDWSKTTAVAVTLGDASKGDGGGAMWYWAPASTDVASASVIVPDNIGVDATLNPTGRGRWVKLLCGCVLAPPR